ncbi:hypothetical protein JBE04_37605 [Streptomyces sp. PRKS01-29]|nr:hypothetical protein [Streptomyces sabulosicollis]MBI0300026.1 hypothetical protein [Streptomyces sabulosicollis]
MGIESEKLVYDYLSRVGDLAQQQGLSSGERMRLVSGLRADIDHRRATGGADSPAGVKRILSKLGSPADVVAAAGGRGPDPGSGGTGGEPGAEGGGTGGGAVPRGAAGAARAARDKLAGLAKSSGLTGKVPAPREEDAPGAPGTARNGDGPAHRTPGDGATSLIKPRPATPATPPSNAASPPHLAGEDELGPRESNMDWWHVEPGPFAQPEQRDAQYGAVEGFTGGIEIPELLGKGKSAEQERQERREAEEKAAAEAAAAEAEAAAETKAKAEAKKAEAGGKQRGALRRVLLGPGKAAGQPAGGGGVAKRLSGLGPVLLVTVGLLVAGAALGNIILIAFGWVIAYSSTYRRSPAEAKWAALGMPGLVAAGAGVWLWGRADRKWGEPIPEDGWQDALTDTWPFVVRGAAIASVLFLLWRARRRG